MQDHNEMMDLVWLLNAACRSANETAALLKDYLEKEKHFREVAKEAAQDSAVKGFLLAELKRNHTQLGDLQGTLAQVWASLSQTRAVMEENGGN